MRFTKILSACVLPGNELEVWCRGVVVEETVTMTRCVTQVSEGKNWVTLKNTSHLCWFCGPPPQQSDKPSSCLLFKLNCYGPLGRRIDRNDCQQKRDRKKHTYSNSIWKLSKARPLSSSGGWKLIIVKHHHCGEDWRWREAREHAPPCSPGLTKTFWCAYETRLQTPSFAAKVQEIAV